MKRIRVTRNGKLVRRRAFRNHILTKKSAKRKRLLDSDASVHQADLDQVRRSLGI